MTGAEMLLKQFGFDPKQIKEVLTAAQAAINSKIDLVNASLQRIEARQVEQARMMQEILDALTNNQDNAPTLPVLGTVSVQDGAITAVALSEGDANVGNDNGSDNHSGE